MRFDTRVIALVLPVTIAAGQDPVIPDDPFFDRQVSFVSPGKPVTFDVASRRSSPRTFDCSAGIDLNVTRAWSVTTGSRDVVVALIDDGFFYAHDDVRENIWANPGESGADEAGYPRETNGRDDDGNGYIDDVVGWDFTFDDPDPDCYIFDGMLNTRIQPYWHSISAMGIIGARGDNGIGVAGVNWHVSMMLLKIGMQGTWPREVADRAGKAARAIRYAADNGARVINWSGFVSDVTEEDLARLKASIDYAAERDVLLVLGAGNFGADIDREENAVYPQCLDCDNILNVAEITFAGTLDERSGRDRISGSCYGVRRVAVAAVARNFTTDVHNARSVYRLGGGTSCAAPVVAGVAALMLSVNPQLGYRDIKAILHETARPLPALAGKVASGGMVDAYAAVRAARPRDEASTDPWPIDPGRVGAVVDGEAVARLRAKAAAERTSGLAVAVDGRIILMEGDDEPIGAMSVSKSITSLAFGFLVDDGTVALDDPAATWIPEWRDTPHEAVTLRHLLSHTSGLHPQRADLNGGDIATHAIDSPLLFEPGSRAAYCNNAVDLLAVIAHRASGTPLDGLLEERLFIPLGITDATWLKDARGAPFAAGELKIRPSALLRVGQMLVDGGRWKGRQILSGEWISRSTKASQPYVPSWGLLWHRSGDFRMALTTSLLARWRSAAVPPEIAAAVVPLVGQTVSSYQEFQTAMLDRLGKEGFQTWQEWLRNHREVHYPEQILVGSSDGFFAEGWLGQYLVVRPATRTVAVRMREFMQVDVDRSQGEQFNYKGFVDDVAALAKLSEDDQP